jgi:hypothetical protein
MKRIHIIGIAFAAIFAFSIITASGASAFTLYDLCRQVTLPGEVGLFNNNDCLELGGTEDWEWFEIGGEAATESLITILKLTSNGTTIDCEGSSVGTIGPGAGGKVTELLNKAKEKVTEAKPVTCELLVAGLCVAPVTAFPVNLPWVTALTASNNLLGNSGAGNPGWTVKCSNLAPNTCTRADTLLTVENLTDELEIDFGFKTLETASCSLGTGIVEGTISILDIESPEGAIQAM